ncbi:MAG: hypothetical protein KC777_30100, partial [Cyanobacteria bacterium HKST-UBA02]|nr:hypothetical protein [Cyanobacteria bacterium HKST-UBA02]
RNNFRWFLISQTISFATLKAFEKSTRIELNTRAQPAGESSETWQKASGLMNQAGCGIGQTTTGRKLLN